MSQGKTSAIKEVPHLSMGYHLGLDYLTRNHPDNTHLISCYEGVGFCNLARYVTFDRSKRVVKLDGYLRRPKRLVVVSASGDVTGVMVTASLPEFYREIEYEDYAIIATDTISEYELLLSHLSFYDRAEVVTFTDRQAGVVKSKFKVRKIHRWSVFACQANRNTNGSVGVRLMDRNDLDMAKYLAESLPEESSPFRLLRFQLKGLPYSNHVFSFADNSRVFVGICPYASGIQQLSYIVGSSASHHEILISMGIAGDFAKAEGCRLIWRLRQTDVTANKAMVKSSGLTKLADENHLHLS